LQGLLRETQLRRPAGGDIFLGRDEPLERIVHTMHRLPRHESHLIGSQPEQLHEGIASAVRLVLRAHWREVRKTVGLDYPLQQRIGLNHLEIDNIGGELHEIRLANEDDAAVAALFLREELVDFPRDLDCELQRLRGILLMNELPS